MFKSRSAASYALALALPGTAWATDCARWADHAPGYCGVLSNSTVCANPANREPGKCNIPLTDWYVDYGKRLIDNKRQSVLAPAGTYVLVDKNGHPLPLISQDGGGLGTADHSRLTPGRSLAGTGGKLVFVVQ